MREKKVSAVIPYCKRLTNIKYALRSLNNQTIPKDEYEVIIGCLEYSSELLDFMKKEVPELNTVLVMSNENWNVSRARNVAIREAIGDVIVFIDADIIIPENYLELHYKTHVESNIPLFVIGQTRDYDEGLDVNKFKLKDFDFYAKKYLNKKAEELDLPEDIRWKTNIYIDWALGWTFNLSVSKLMMEKDKLLFDENFKGWGVEDIEWAYRVTKYGSKMIFSDEIWAIHLPHKRDVNKNHTDEKINFKKMLYKWPELDVEIVTTFGDIKGNQNFSNIMKDIFCLTTKDHPDVCTIEFNDQDGKKFLYIGGSTNFQNKTVHNNLLPDELKKYSIKKILPLFGFSLPYADNSVEKVFYSPNLSKISNSLKVLVDEEAKRLSSKVISIEQNEVLLNIK